MKYLNALLAPDVLAIGLCIPTVEGLLAFLRADPHVIMVKKRLAVQATDIADLRKFVEGVVGKIVPGRRSAWDVTMAAVAVALERKPGSFAEEYIVSLSKLNIAELPLSSKIASIIAKEREHSLAGNHMRTSRMGIGQARTVKTVSMRLQGSSARTNVRKSEDEYRILEVV